MVIFSISEAGVRTGLVLSLAFLLFLLLVRWNRDGAQWWLLILGYVGGWLVLKLGELGVDRGATGEVADNKGRRRVNVNVRRGDAWGEVGVDAFLEAIVLKAVDTEFPFMYCLLITLLVLMDELKVGLNCNMHPPIMFQFSMHRKFSHLVNCVDLVH